MEVVLSAGVDTYIRRAWYEGCDFIPRKFHRDGRALTVAAFVLS